MPSAQVNGIELCYETLGDQGDEPLLLIMGLGSQLIDWPDGFCQALLDAGFRLVLFDNRDSGLSTKTEGPPPAMELSTEGGLYPSLAAPPPYGLADMAADAVGLLDVLGIERAHVLGASLGGMIAQHVAFGHPERVLSLTSVMSTSGDGHVGQPTPEAGAALLNPPPLEREAYIEAFLVTSKLFSGPHWREDITRERAAKRYDRCFHPIGSAFQLSAAIADGNRTERLAGVRCPTLVIHGAADPLITLSGGEATAAAIPGAELLVFETMGHDLPEPLWADIVAAVRKLADGV